jgi:hypothetical protein
MSSRLSYRSIPAAGSWKNRTRQLRVLTRTVRDRHKQDGAGLDPLSSFSSSSQDLHPALCSCSDLRAEIGGGKRIGRQIAKKDRSRSWDLVSTSRTHPPTHSSVTRMTNPPPPSWELNPRIPRRKNRRTYLGRQRHPIEEHRINEDRMRRRQLDPGSKAKRKGSHIKPFPSTTLSLSSLYKISFPTPSLISI